MLLPYNTPPLKDNKPKLITRSLDHALDAGDHTLDTSIQSVNGSVQSVVESIKTT